MLGIVTGPMLSVAFHEPDDLIACLVAAVPTAPTHYPWSAG